MAIKLFPFLKLEPDQQKSGLYANILCQMFIIRLYVCLMCDKWRWDLELRRPLCALLVVCSCFMNLFSLRRPCRTLAAVWLLCQPAALQAPGSPRSLGRWPACSPLPRPWGSWAGTFSGWDRPRWSSSCQWQLRSDSGEGEGPIVAWSQIWLTFHHHLNLICQLLTLNWLEFMSDPILFKGLFDIVR